MLFEILVLTEEGTARAEALILRFLLGLDDDPTGLDQDDDGQIDVADLITRDDPPVP